MCFATWPTGRGTWVRHPSNDAVGAAGGAVVDSARGINAADIETETSADDGVESSVSDAAQQLSAWA